MSASADPAKSMGTVVSPPRRYIFNDHDMARFSDSSAKKELLRLTNAMGKSCASAEVSYKYAPDNPLQGLTPAMAALHGSLQSMLTWIDDIPPVQDRSIVRFGNPSFKKWHARLLERSTSIVYNVLQKHKEHEGNNKAEYDEATLKAASDEGYQASKVPKDVNSVEDEKDRETIIELSAYLHAAFGHHVRLDYGTGHECSFQVFLFALCKLGCFGSTPEEPPSMDRLKAVTLSIWSAYLNVSRQLQVEYMLEPAGSHGVWGLDDYYCLPFYFGACQQQADGGDYTPQSIHDASALQRDGDNLMYFGAIRFIKEIKKGAPFFECSPMLNDISNIPTWSKVATGLLRLFEGEVLGKRQVVQHFVFGNIFAADWTPSQQEIESAPSETFRDKPAGVPVTRAPWATGGAQGGMPVTKAPWATGGAQGGMPVTKAPWAK